MTTSTWDNVFTNKAEQAYMYTALYSSVPCRVDMVLHTDYCSAKQFYVGLVIQKWGQRSLRLRIRKVPYEKTLCRHITCIRKSDQLSADQHVRVRRARMWRCASFVTPSPRLFPVCDAISLMNGRKIVSDLKQPILPKITSPTFPIHKIVYF